MGIVRRLFVALVLSVTFLGGYYLGRRPESPDIIGGAGRVYQTVLQTVRQLAAWCGFMP